MLNRGKVIFKRIFLSQDRKLPNQASDNQPRASPLEDTVLASQSQQAQTMQQIPLDIVKEFAKQRSDNIEKFVKLIDESDGMLLKISSVFPFDLFPDSITIDPIKVNIVSREFFFSACMHTIYVKNILDILVDCSVFFATMRIMYEGFGPNVVYVKYLKKGEAQKARRIIQGLVVATREGVDFSRLDANEVRQQIEMLGEAKLLEGRYYK